MASLDLPGLTRRIRPQVETALAEGRRDLLVAAVTGTILSAVGFAILGVVVFFLLAYLVSSAGRGRGVMISGSLFLVLYVAALVLLFVASFYYQPKERYYFGYRRYGGYGDDPFTLRDDLDRAHAFLGFLLAIPNFIRLNLGTLKDAVATRGAPVEPTLAAGVLLMAQEGTTPGAILSAHTDRGEKAVARALDDLRMLGWLRFDRATGRVGLKSKGVELLRRAGV